MAGALTVKLKVCLVGDEAVGKTSLIRRYVLNQFSPTYMRTIGTMVSKRTQDIVLGTERVQVDLILWDIMGQKGFMDLLRDAYFYKANGLLAVADLSRPETVGGLEAWLEGARAAVGHIPVEILGNKVDLVAGDATARRDLADLAHRFDAGCHLTSAKTGEGVEGGFASLARRALGTLAEAPHRLAAMA